MKKQKLKILVTLTFILCSVSTVFASQRSDYQLNVTTQFGVNLSCGEFGGGSGGVLNSSYTYPTTAELDYYKSKGLTLIRMPFVWDRVQHDLNGPLDTGSDLLMIKNFVKSAQDRGINVILDMHNYARRKVNGTDYLIGQTDNLKIADFVDVWTKLANEFKGYTNIWGYDLMNEPNNMGSVSLFKITQAVVTGIRTVDLNTPIVIEGNDYASSYSWPSNKSDSLKYLVDPSNKLIYEAHCYFDYYSSGIYAGTYDAEIKTASIALIRLKPFIDWLKLNNKVGMIGEFGVPNDDPRWLTMLDGALNYMKQNNVSGTYWAAGPWWGTYPLSIEPDGNVDKPQMAILSKYGNDKISAVEELKSAKISVYPNPTTDNIFIKSDSKIKSVDIYNNLGILLFQQKTNNQESQIVIPLSQFVSGNYVLKVMLEDNSFVIKKVVKI